MLYPYAESGLPVAQQEKILETICTNPLASYVFSGPPGVGKTTLLREVERLARVARPKNFPVYSRSMMQYQHDATAVARGESVGVFVRPHSIRNEAELKLHWGVFLDDFDKVSGSEFIRLQVFELVNAICETDSQLVISTNMNREEFAKFFGDHIAWRVLKHCTWIEMNRGS